MKTTNKAITQDVMEVVTTQMAIRNLQTYVVKILG